MPLTNNSAYMTIKKFISLSVLLLSLVAVQAAPTVGKTYRIVISSKSMFVKNASFNPNDDVVLWTETDVPAQRWKLEKATDGKYAFRNLYSGLYLAAKSTPAAGVTLVQKSGSVKRTTGAWNIKPVEGLTDVFTISAGDNEGLCIGIDQAAADGNQLKLVEPATVEKANVYCRIIESEVPTAFDAAVRDEMMQGFINQHYKKATGGHILGGGGWWGDAEMFEVILDAFETTGDKKYQTYFRELYNNFLIRNNSDWSYNEFNDDITWMVLACIRAYKYFGDEEYLKVARFNFDNMYQRAAKQPHGTLIWKQSQPNPLSTNSCINGPAIVAACYLGEMTGEKEYYDKALSIYDGQRQLLFDAKTGQVYDSRAWNADGSIANEGFNSWASTYNQGTMLGAATMLYKYTGEKKYKQDADAVYRFTCNKLTNNKKIISVCQTINGDLCGFKGILMRYVRRYAEDLDSKVALQWIAKNAWHAYQNRMLRGPRSVTWSAWLTKTAQNLSRQENGGTTNVSNDPVGQATAVSAAVNAHINGLYDKDASQQIGVEFFDEIQWLQLAEKSSDDDTPETTVSSRDGAYIAFKHVDFGSNAVSKLLLRAKATASDAKIQVYVDNISSETLVAVSKGPLPTSWDNLVLDASKSLSGVHTVYIVLTKGVALQSFSAYSTSSGIHASTLQPRSDSNYIYNLQGVRVSTPLKGIYIQNGRKFIVK